MQIATITQPLIHEYRKTTARKTETPNIPPVDFIDLSTKALQLNETKNTALSANINAQLDIRMEKIEAVKKKIELGYYNSDEFLDKLVDKLIADKILF
jgi:anti-sigma28 factor (negative regulator of flagellin synthesis)